MARSLSFFLACAMDVFGDGGASTPGLGFVLQYFLVDTAAVGCEDGAVLAELRGGT